jgi:cytochrome c biogenesis protein CcdA
MSGMQRLRYIFLIAGILVFAIGVFASVTVVLDYTPMNAVTLGMVAYCMGLGTVFVFIFLRLRKGYNETVKTLAKEDKTPEKEKKTEQKEAEY